jgi:hypothetical protein
MTPDTETQKSIQEQILDTMFVALSKQVAFDAVTVEKLRQLAEKDDLKKASLVTKAIKVESEATQ